jgi:hypothetical protein
MYSLGWRPKRHLKIGFLGGFSMVSRRFGV